MAAPFAAFLRRKPMLRFFWALGAAAPAASDHLTLTRTPPVERGGPGSGARSPMRSSSAAGLSPYHDLCPLPADGGRPASAAPAVTWQRRAGNPDPVTHLEYGTHPSPGNAPSWPTGGVRLSTVLAALLRRRLPRKLARLLLHRWRAKAAAAAQAAGRRRPAVAAAEDWVQRRVHAALRWGHTRHCSNSKIPQVQRLFRAGHAGGS